ncbi:MAG: undecaprenyl-diphosphate phosphatase [Thermodesulfobacteriota bacterium]
MSGRDRSFRVCICLLASAFLLGVSSAGMAALGPHGEKETAPEMTISQATVLGIVEGVTEFLPISSTGHLLLAQRAMEIGGGSERSWPSEGPGRKEASDAYAICIQGGAILAILFLYWRRARSMAWGLLGRDHAGLGLALRVTLAFVPAALLGVALEDRIKEHLFGLWPVVSAWLVGGIVILWFARWMGEGRDGIARPLEDLSWRGALLIGIIQCVAMWPGVSRSLATILGGILAGLSLSAAVEFSFLLGVVTLGAATVFDTIKHGQVMAQFFDPMSMAAGFFSAFISALLAVRWMVGYLQRHGLEIFGYYRIAAAAIVSALLFFRFM